MADKASQAQEDKLSLETGKGGGRNELSEWWDRI